MPYSRLRRLHISFGEACNIRCIMCFHPVRHARNPLFLQASAVIRNVDIAPFEEIVIQGGEPLFVPPCLEFMSYLESRGKRYTLLTNGLLIDETMADRLALHAKAVSISINGATKPTHEMVNRGSNFEALLANIRRLVDARTRHGTDVVVCGRMTLTPQNVHEVPLFLRTFRELGFDKANFGFVKKTVPAFLASHKALVEHVRRGADAALRHIGWTDVDVLRLRQLGLLEAIPPSMEGVSRRTGVSDGVQSTGPVPPGI